MKLTPKNIHHYTNEILLNAFIKDLFLVNALIKDIRGKGYIVKESAQWQDDTDGTIYLGGDATGVHIEVTNGSYAVAVWRGDSYFKTDGKGKISDEIKAAKYFANGTPNTLYNIPDNIPQRLNYIENFLRREDINGLLIFQDYRKECQTTQDQISLINSFEPYLEDEMKERYFLGLRLMKK